VQPEQTISSRTIYEGRIISLRVDDVDLGDGRRSVREIVEHPGAVAILVLTEQDELVLVRQYRKAAEQFTLEIPAGTLGKGEDPLACAARELREETGFSAHTIRQICSFYTAVGFCTELMYMFLATGLTAGAQAFDEDEDIEVQTVPVAKAVEMINNGVIVDSKTVAGVLWAHSFVSGGAVTGWLK
jgi:ADP-ribose pyrophosphatase